MAHRRFDYLHTWYRLCIRLQNSMTFYFHHMWASDKMILLLLISSAAVNELIVSSYNVVSYIFFDFQVCVKLYATLCYWEVAHHIIIATINRPPQISSCSHCAVTGQWRCGEKSLTRLWHKSPATKPYICAGLIYTPWLCVIGNLVATHQWPCRCLLSTYS